MENHFVTYLASVKFATLVPPLPMWLGTKAYMYILTVLFLWNCEACR